MVNLTRDQSPEEFLVEYFTPDRSTIGPAGPQIRVLMIPLIVTPHDWWVLDANVELFSCRYCVQHSCMGLFPRYSRRLQDRGEFFAASTSDGRAVGLASARLDSSGHCWVDGFLHRNFSEAWEALIAEAANWGTDRGAVVLKARVAREDEEKVERFRDLGFEVEGAGEPFGCQGTTLSSRIMISTT